MVRDRQVPVSPRSPQSASRDLGNIVSIPYSGKPSNLVKIAIEPATQWIPSSRLPNTINLSWKFRLSSAFRNNGVISG